MPARPTPARCPCEPDARPCPACLAWDTPPTQRDRRRSRRRAQEAPAPQREAWDVRRPPAWDWPRPGGD